MQKAIWAVIFWAALSAGAFAQTNEATPIATEQVTQPNVAMTHEQLVEQAQTLERQAQANVYRAEAALAELASDAPGRAAAEDNLTQARQRHAQARANVQDLRANERRAEDETNIRRLFLGVGVGLTHNLSGTRTENITVAERDDERLFVQVNESQDTDIRVLFETHYLLRDATIFDENGQFRNVVNAVGAIAACGPFAFSVGGRADRGCGPFVAVALESDAEVAEFGLGWFVGYGHEEEQNSFGIGVGIIVDPDSETIDGRIVDTETMLVRPEFEEAVRNQTVSVTNNESTVSFLVMVTKDFAL